MNESRIEWRCTSCGFPEEECLCAELDEEAELDDIDLDEDDLECVVCGEDLEDCLCDGEEDTDDERYDDYDDDYPFG